MEKLGNNKGSALMAALLLVAVSSIMGATILFATSTEVQISGNFRRAVKTFYAAEAGLAEMQQRLSGLPTANPAFLGDLTSSYQQNWSAYIFSQSDWKTEDDHSYNSFLTNYVPISGNPQNTLVRSNSVQSELAYWAKVHHKTEYEAEQAGHRPGKPHYSDEDGDINLHSARHRGQLVRFGYPLPTSVKAEQFTTRLKSLYAPVEVITSHGQVEGADSILQADVVHPAGPPLWAPVYVGDQLVISGGSIAIQGTDVCRMLPAGLPPISLAPSASFVGAAGLTGNPSIPQTSPMALDLNQQILDLQKGTTQVFADLVSVKLGSEASPVALYAEPSDGTLQLAQVTGFGILSVKGNLQIAAPFQWEGFVIVSGEVIFSGGLGSSFLNGALYADRVQILNNDVSVNLDTCPIKKTLRTLPVSVLSWRQLL